MTRALHEPLVTDVLLSVLIVLGSLVTARLLSILIARVVRRAARRTPTTLDDHLAQALQRPLASAVFLAGAYLALHRLPFSPPVMRRLDATLFVAGVFLVTLALVRSYGLVLEWYRTESKAATTSLAVEFAPLFSKVGKGFIGLLAAITILQHFGVNVASLVVSLGVGSLAVGLAAQDTLSNMFAGFTLMLDRPFRVGDRIQLSTGESGDVEQIGMRATLIRTMDETLLIVPNSVLVKERLVNLNRPTRRLAARVEVTVAYGSDLSEVRRILAEAAAASAYADREREPVVQVSRFGELGVTVLLTFWVRDYQDQGLARTEVHELVYRRLQEGGIGMATGAGMRLGREGELSRR